MSDERGSALAFTVVFLVVLLGVAALVVDWGSWFTEQRHLQAAADAATMAAAQDLPNTALASTTATTYAASNATGLNTWTPAFPNSNTIDVTLTKKANGIFSTFLGINSMNVHAHARAMIGAPDQMKNVAPVVVNRNLACMTGSNCFGPSHGLDLNFDDPTGPNTRAGLIDVTGHASSSTACVNNVTSTSTMRGWITGGYPNLLPVNHWYAVPPGVKNGIKQGFDDAVSHQSTLLFPVIDNGISTACGGAGGFHVIGWSAFVITSVVRWSSSHILHGYFVEYIAHDVNITPGVPLYGVKVIGLVQ
ncbi:MAG: hypothetical protein H0W87_01485 [Actinobacteria bacterium]|nr:hypothetical protein [Actinomycetota bacterium]